MKSVYPFLSVCFVLSLLTLPVSAQEPVKEQPTIPAPATVPNVSEVLPQPVLPPLYQNSAPALPRMNPAVLMKMKNDLTFELQNTQRTLGLIDPNDAALKKTLTDQQSELLQQLKDINEQLKAQGISLDGEPNELTGQPKKETLMNGAPLPPNIPTPPNPGIITDPALLIQRGAAPPTGNLPPHIPPVRPVPREYTPAPMEYTPPQPFDQDRAWNNSPWVPQPSKELTEMKQTVESLRTEISSLKESVKALETQIQLLNRNILLSQPK